MNLTETITWIPVNERLPDTKGMSVRVLATFYDQYGERRVERVQYDDVIDERMPWTRLEVCNEYEPIDPIAWAETPEGYKP